MSVMARNYEEHKPNQEKMIGGMEMGGRRARRAPERFEFKQGSRHAAEANLDAEAEASGGLHDSSF